MTELRQEMIRQMKLRNFSKRTQDSYIYQIKNLARHFNRSPDKLSHKELQDYLIYLKEERNLSFRSCNVARSAIRFLYGKVLEDQEICLSIPSQRTPKFLPEVLSVEEVKDIISATTTLRNRLLLMAAYSGGLRLGELVALGVRHIDSKRMVIRMISVGSRKCWGIATSQRRWFTSMYHGKVFPGFNPLWISMISKQIRRWRMEKAVDQKESVAPNQQSRIEVADIFRHYIGDYQKAYKLHPDHYKVVNDILECRTAILGGHIYSCTECGHRINVYNSCGNRHCPKCQTTAKARWLEDRKSELLPVPYFHVVFTLPHDINPLALCNKRQLYILLFKAASETLLSFGENPENGLGGKLGLISILHTWDQTLNDHIHLHCLVPGGVLTNEKDEFKVSNESYLFPVQALSKVFRAKYMDKTEKMTLDAIEFIRRFLLHVVPRNFMRIRHFGLFANRCKKKNISLCQALLNAGRSNTASIQKSVEDIMYALTGEDIRCCPVCKKGVMVKLSIRLFLMAIDEI